MTRLIELLIALAIVAVIFVSVGAVLPSSRHLSHTVETNRKQTIVFDTLNSLRRFEDWNPLPMKDRAMQIKLSGPEEGVGARLDYTSEERGLGQGSWEIVESVPGSRVVYAVEDVEPGRNKRTAFDLRKTGTGGRNIAIDQTFDVDYGWNLIGRYAGLYVSSNVGDDMKLGLARLTNMLATVPNYDYAEMSQADPANAPKLADRPAENLLVVTAVVPRDNDKVLAQMKGNVEWIRKVMAANGLESAGPVRIITNDFGAESYSFDVAQPVRKAGATGPATAMTDIKLEGPVTVVFNDPAKLATASFKGHMANLPRMRDAVRGWALTRGFETIDRPYEVWKAGIDAGFTEEGQYDIYWSLN